MLYAGIDLGTSSVKLLLMDKEGTIINTVTEEYPIYFPKTGWAEQNPEDWYRSVMTGMKRLLEGRTGGNQFWRSDAWTCCP